MGRGPQEEGPPEKKSEEATVQGIRETRSKDLLVELKCSTKSRGRLQRFFELSCYEVSSKSSFIIQASTLAVFIVVFGTAL